MLPINNIPVRQESNVYEKPELMFIALPSADSVQFDMLLHVLIIPFIVCSAKNDRVPLSGQVC